MQIMPRMKDDPVRIIDATVKQARFAQLTKVLNRANLVIEGGYRRIVPTSGMCQRRT